VKRSEFVRELTQAGCQLLRHGSRHDIYANPANGKRAPVPRHTEIKNSLCRLIRRQLGLADPTQS
jgi:predicted RNA binding protein YcfA (HicA-like mRNA interferase family)